MLEAKADDVVEDDVGGVEDVYDDPVMNAVRSEVLKNPVWRQHAAGQGEGADGKPAQRPCDVPGCVLVKLHDVVRMRHSARVLSQGEREARFYLYFDMFEGFPTIPQGRKTAMQYKLRTEDGVVDTCQPIWCLAHDISLRHLGNLRSKNRAQVLVPGRHGLIGRKSNAGVNSAQKDEIIKFIRDIAERVGTPRLPPMWESSTSRPYVDLPREYSYAQVHRMYVHAVKERLAGGASGGGAGASAGGDGGGGSGAAAGVSVSAAAAVAAPGAALEPAAVDDERADGVDAGAAGMVDAHAADGHALPHAHMGGEVIDNLVGDGGMAMGDVATEEVDVNRPQKRRKHNRKEWVSVNAFKTLWLELYVPQQRCPPVPCPLSYALPSCSSSSTTTTTTTTTSSSSSSCHYRRQLHCHAPTVCAASLLLFGRSVVRRCPEVCIPRHKRPETQHQLV
jgi:hypothetical protein